MAGRAIRFLNGLITFAEIAMLLAAMLYSGYALWDNRQVYDQVENATAELREIKALSGDEPLSLFDQLRFINPDVTAWICMDGTAIDYPVLQGSSNFSYINTDVYGDFAMLGSIFMDYRSSRDFSDPYTLLLGHDMSGHRMFSDVNLYKDEAFFRANTAGTLTLPDGEHRLRTLSVIVTGASDSLFFNPMNWNSLSPADVLGAVREGAMYTDPEGIRLLEGMLSSPAGARIVALSTCSSEFTDARTILLTVMDPVDVLYTAAQTGDCFE